MAVNGAHHSLDLAERGILKTIVSAFLEGLGLKPPQYFVGLDLRRHFIPEPGNQEILDDVIVEVLRSMVREPVVLKVMRGNETERRLFASIRLVDEHIETSTFNFGPSAGLR